MTELIHLFDIPKDIIKDNERQRRVYSVEGIAPSLLARSDGPKFLVGGDDMKKIFAMRRRDKEDGTTYQKVEFRKDDTTSTLTSVHKDNLLWETEGEDETMRKLKVNDLFCGAGGMGLGFQQGGFEIAGAWDFDRFAVESYKHNVGDHVQMADVQEMTFKDLPYADVWTFGAPCQAFSIAGKQLGMMFHCKNCGHEQMFDGEQIIDRETPCESCNEKSEPKDVRGILFFEVMRLLKETNIHQPENIPPIIMLENVKGIKKFLDVVEYEYEKRGYKLYKTLYNSKFWGVPQNRERYFVVGVHESIEKEFIFPEQQQEYIPRLSTVLEQNVEENFYIDPEKSKVIIEQAIGKIEEHKLIDDQGRNKPHHLKDISPTIKAEEHGNNKKVVLQVKEATKKGYAEATEGDSINLSHPNSTTRRGRVGKQVAQTLLTGTEQAVVEGINTVKNGKEFHSKAEESVTLMARDWRGPSGKQPFTMAMEQQKSVEEVAASVLDIAKQSRPSEQLSIKIAPNGNIRPHRMDERKSGLSELNVAYEGNEGFTCTSSHANKIYGETTNFRIRKLTPREYARLQGFPDSFEIVVSNSQAYKQFGNAVTVNVSRAIAERIRMFLLSL